METEKDCEAVFDAENMTIPPLIFKRLTPERTVGIESDELNRNFYYDGKAVYTRDRCELIFFSAYGDTEYAVKPGCKKIRDKAFDEAWELRRVVLPKGLTVIGELAFRACRKLAEAELPEGLTEVGRGAFINCERLEKLTLPSTLEAIGEDAFRGCQAGITVELPEALRYIGSNAFCNNWTLVLNEKNKHFISSGEFILSGDGRKFIRTAKPSAVVTVPDNVTEIADGFFSENRQIEKVILPKTVHTIGNEAFLKMWILAEINLENVGRIGSSAFEHCLKLEKISLKCGSIGEFAFCMCEGLTEAEADCEIIGASAFRACRSLQKAVLKNTRIIGKAAFGNTPSLNELILPPGLEEIGNYAFSGSGIKVLKIPKTVRRIGENIANYKTTEIHIYDNIETDICRENDISPADYTLYVHSAETDAIKYAVPVFGYTADPEYGYSEHDKTADMFRGGVNFDFKEFDRYFDSLVDIEFMHQKFEASRLRLKYGYELDEETRRKYGEYIRTFAPRVMEEIIEYYQEEIGGLFDPDLYNYLSVEQILPFIDKTTQKNLTEFTAFLLRIINEKRAGENKSSDPTND